MTEGRQCPKCRAASVDVAGGPGAGSGLPGALLADPLWFVCGLLGSNTLKYRCTGCGHVWGRPDLLCAAVGVIAAVACISLVFICNETGLCPALSSFTPPPSRPPPGQTARVAQMCHLREEPSSNSLVIGTVDPSQRVIVVSEADGWVKVRTVEGAVGWTGPACWE